MFLRPCLFNFLTESGGIQTLERPPNPNAWDFLSAIYLERRTFEIAATAHIDGGLSCLSGRTFAIRSEIVQNQRFVDEFRGEKWLGVLSLVAADDDNFITRYLVNNGWKIAVQFDKGAELTTTLENNPKFLAQCIRWRRTTWRSNFTSLFLECVIWRYADNQDPEVSEGDADIPTVSSRTLHMLFIFPASTLRLWSWTQSLGISFIVRLKQPGHCPTSQA